MTKLKFVFAIVMVMLCKLTLQAVDLPQFSSSSYKDWDYNNSYIDLSVTNILANRIVLYTTKAGFTYQLTSPQFDCSTVGGVSMDVTWVTDQWKTEQFNVDKVTLTATLLDETGTAIDSVTYAPDSVSRTNLVHLELTIPKSMKKAQLRFVSWKGDVNSSGAVRQIVITPTETSSNGDVNGDGETTIADINTITEVMLGAITDAETVALADVNGDDDVSLADINDVVDKMASNN